MDRLDGWLTLISLVAFSVFGLRRWLTTHPGIVAALRNLLPRQLTLISTTPAMYAQRSLPTAPQLRAPLIVDQAPAEPAQTPPGVRRAPWHILRQIVAEYPHIALKGPTGGGKTFLAHALLADREGQFVIIDPDWEQGKWSSLPVITTDDDDGFSPIEEALQGLLVEMKRRVVAARTGQPKPPMLTIVWDEIPECMEECKTAGEVLRRILRRGRKYNMRLLALSQSDRVKAWGVAGQGDALDNLLWIHLGGSALDLIPELASTPFPAVAVYQGNNNIPLDTSEAVNLVKRPLNPDIHWQPTKVEARNDTPLVEAPAPAQPAAPVEATFTATHLRVAAWLTAEPEITNCEIARRLWGGDGGGRYAVKAGDMRRTIEAVIKPECSAVPAVTPVTELVTPPVEADKPVSEELVTA